MKAAKLIYPILIAGAVVMSGAAHAQAVGEALQAWSDGITKAVDTLTSAERESQIKALTTTAQDRLSKIACTTEEEAKRSDVAVKKWKEVKKLPVDFMYDAHCNGKSLAVKFTFTKLTIDTAQEAREDAANLAKLTGVISIWGQAMRKAVDENHEQNRLKDQIDTVTGAAVLAFNGVACRRAANVSVSDLLTAEVAKQHLQIEHTPGSPQCDSLTHTWRIGLKVNKFTMAFDPKKDAGETNQAALERAAAILDKLFADAKTFIDPQTIGWDKFVQQSQAAHQKIAAYVTQLDMLPCGVTPYDKTAGAVQSMITTKAAGARTHLTVDSVRVLCNAGRLEVAMNAEPVKPAPPQTFPH